ncbi:hypothetical protein Back11_52360 [Paenibacillus baekrokdamisoli]|uniref:Uncharacterized protein n=1 Tax=Paenibacillus baekrokdamisoli TaxID=1712516 RepID=A0A3G9JD48_9BACL|nr:hypothetical protein [Paenibacillus baekrokdamisoli]MBB3069074.1 hypothetical protein [Paenibacillus baekrokdamisoli]BBH23891.1 hypothetical protein Back11_52360 [Paenibacillus baekrokdamisoli]
MRFIQRAGFSIVIASTALLPITQLSFTPQVSAAATISTTTTLKAFNLGGSSSAQVTDLQFLYGNEKTAYFTVSVYNGSSKDLNFMDYWVELWTKSGNKYTIKLDDTDAKNSKVIPKSTKDFHFSAKVNMNSSLTDFKFKLIKWDFSQASYTRTLGEVSVPIGYNQVVAAGAGKVVKYDNKKMSSILLRSQFAVIGGQLEGALVYRLTNYSGQTISLANLNYYIKRSGGTLSKMNVDATGDQQLYPGGSKEIQLFGSLPITKLDPNMQLIVTATNQESKAETPIATYTIKPLSQQEIFVKPNTEGSISIDGVNIKTKIRDTFYDSNSDNEAVSMYLSLNNGGKQTVNLPAYSYFLMTAGGALYPAKLTQTTPVELAPSIVKEQYLQFSLPNGTKITDLKLVIRKTSEENKKGYVVGLFQVPSQSTDQNASQKAIKYVTQQGLFEFSVISGERLPWGEQDLVNAVITIRNPQLNTKSLPNIKASLLLNGFKVDDKDIQLIPVDNTVAIAGSTYFQYIVSTKVPYTYNTSDITVVLSEAAGADGAASTPIGRFKLSGNKMILPVLKPTDTMDVKGVGRTAVLMITQVNTYVADNSKILYAEFDYKNLEQRFANLANLQAYFKTKDGNYIQANFQNIKDKVSSSKSSLVMAYAKFPEKNYDLTGVELWVGQGVTQGKFTTADGIADGYVNAVNYHMPVEKTDVQTTFDNLKINPYKITIDNISQSLQDTYKINFDFKYDLSKIADYEKVAGNHQLVIELVDKDNKFEQKFELENGNDALKIGEDIKASVAFEDQKLWGIIYRQYTLNIYDGYQGHKKLLATQTMNKPFSNG